MRLAVSNIAWARNDESVVLPELRRRGVTGIEVAPTRLWPDWVGTSPRSARAIRDELAAEGFEIPAVQAILFGKPELGLLDTPDAFIDHVRFVADLAAELGAGVLVYGAPKSRIRGERNAESAFDQAVEVLREIGRSCVSRNIAFCIEPNPPAYGCDFVTTSAEAIELVAAVDSPGVRAHLDTAAMALAGEEPGRAIAAARALLAHFHVSAPDLAPIAPTPIDHCEFGRALHRACYDGWISIEMRRAVDPVGSLVRAIDHVRNCYWIRQEAAARETADSPGTPQ